MSEELDRESSHEKAEIKRLTKRLEAEIAILRQETENTEKQIDYLQNERKTRSEALQHWLFEQQKIFSAEGEVSTIWEIFQSCGRGVPPAGSGECAAPRLLQYAYANELRPISMAEFWVGQSPKNIIRIENHYYPACQSKCGPLLRHILRGLNVAPNPLELKLEDNVEIVYEDEYLLVVCKPAGLMTISDDPQQDSLMRRLRAARTISGPGYVHRLDMPTSGLVLIAKDKSTHEKLQQLFENHAIRKRYVALVEGIPTNRKGIIRLPISPNVDDRPRQMVDFEHGKIAITNYEVVETYDQTCRIIFRPLTGRTHQLRLHAAHPKGLGCPIVGDNLYGTLKQRLMLHAEYLEFVHPIIGRRLRIERKPDF